MYYIYALVDVRCGLPFYIGKGLKANSRHMDHFNESIESTCNKHKVFKINFLRSSGFDIPVNVLVDEIEDENNAYEIETEFIKKYGRKNIDPGGILTNICLDNRPPIRKGEKQSSSHVANRVSSYKETCERVGRKPHSDETKRKIARYGKENPFYGKTHSDEFRQAHSNRMKGNKNNSKKYIFTDPTGKDYTVVGEFYKFCNEHGLTTSTMEKILYKGISPKFGKCKGWGVKKENNK